MSESQATAAVAASQVVRISADHLEILRRCGGYYGCPKDAAGKRLGPLVGYAGKYDGEHQWVGEVYFNFAMAEQYPQAMAIFAFDLANIMRAQSVDVGHLLSAPMGGIVFGFNLARELDRQFAFAEKKITVVTTADAREVSELTLKRHEIQSGSKVVLVEDVCNNFSTTEKIRDLLESVGASLAGIACVLNRSPETSWEDVPVMSLLHIPSMQWKQDDPAVAEDIAAGNVVWKPKNEWDKLAAAMEAAAGN